MLYNEIEPFACDWLENLIRARHLPAGTVDRRPIQEIRHVSERHAHFFAGIGGWPLALRLVKWPDDLSVWTGSCPCQPFSSAGRGRGTSDPRHLWPEWFRLIRDGLPSVVLGEQVASPAGRAWFDLVSSDLESLGYTCRAVDLSAAGIGAPHQRQRIYLAAVGPSAVADRDRDRGRRHTGTAFGAQDQSGCSRGPDRDLAHGPGDGGIAGALAEPERGGRGAWGLDRAYGRPTIEPDRHGATGRPDPWTPCEWIICRDGKTRPVEPGTFPLAHGVPGRVGKLRAYGNAIVPEVAATFARSVLDCLGR